MSDVIVVGGGVIGMLTARELLAQGMRVTMIDKSEPGREASWAGGGIVSPLYPWNYVPAISALASWAQDCYPSLIEQLLAETGIDPELSPCGLLMLNPPEPDLALRWAREFNKDMRVVEPGFVLQQEPAANQDFDQALWLPYVSNVRNPRLLQALQASLSLNQAFELIASDGVEGLSPVANGQVQVQLQDGQIRVADKAVVCAGAWSAPLLAKVGYRLPVVPVRGQMLLFDARPGLLNGIILKDGKYLIPRRDGHILAGSTTEDAGFDKTTSADARALLLSHAYDMVPALQSVPVVKQWAGLRPGSPGGIPFIGRVPGWDNLFINAGHYRNGLVLAPASARLMADLVIGQTPIVNPEPYNPARMQEPVAMI